MSVEPEAAPAGPAEAEAVRAAARAGDFDRYLAALLAPADRRGDLLAIAAFLGEAARIPASVREPMMGEIRLQWWRDVLSADAAGRTGNPVADAMRPTIRRCELPRETLLRVLEARSFELYPDPFPDDAALAGYLAGTEGAAVELGLRALGVADPAPLAQVSAPAGRALGLARLLAGLPLALSRGRMPLPLPRITAANADIADLTAGRCTGPVRALLAGLGREARASLREARAACAYLPRGARAAILPLALVEPHLRALEGARLDPLRDLVELLPLVRVCRLWWADVTGRV